MNKIRFEEGKKSGKTFDEAKLHYLLSDEAGMLGDMLEWPPVSVQIGMSNLTDEQKADLDAAMERFAVVKSAPVKLRVKRGKKYTKPKKR